MALPMDNIFFRFLLQCWPVIIAVIVTVLLAYQWMRPKFTAEKLQKGLIRQSVLIVVGEAKISPEEVDHRDWLETRQRVQKHVRNNSLKNEVNHQKLHYKDYISISLCWTIFWIGAVAFVSLRILFNPYYYGHEAVFLCYFTYYIVIGLISYFRK